ncbi:MAG: AraC family transcriptional regulator [Burkholderiaceae bacterium]
MPHQRLLLGRSAGLQVEEVRFAGRPARASQAVEWSPVYQPAGDRMVLPGEGTTEVRIAGDRLLADALTAWFLAAGASYQVGEVGTCGRTNVVVSGDGGSSHGLPGRPALLAPRALLRLRLHWKALRTGEARAGETPAIVRAAGEGAGVACSTGAAGRTRRFVAAAVAAGESHSLDEIAEEVGGSPFHLARSFRKATGLSIHQYRTQLRMALALARIEQGECDLAGLAHDLGYAHQSHFGEVFRSETGMTPGQARAALGPVRSLRSG